jgi:hypothetical protein
VDVGLESVGADLEGTPERREGVLAHFQGGAAMGVDPHAPPAERIFVFADTGHGRKL